MARRTTLLPVSVSLRQLRVSVEETGMAAHTFHFKIRGRENWGTVGRYIDQIGEARARGLDVTANQYPYPALYHGWSAFFPLWAREGEPGAFAERLHDPEVWQRIRNDSTYQVLVRRARLVGGDRPGKLLQSRAHALREHDGGRDRQGEGRRRSGHDVHRAHGRGRRIDWRDLLRHVGGGRARGHAGPMGPQWPPTARRSTSTHLACPTLGTMGPTPGSSGTKSGRRAC